MIRIIDHKKMELTDDEWNMYQEICKSYDRINFQGSSLFEDLFETDNDGIILFLKPPKKQTSLEILTFLQSICLHQHIRNMYKKIDESILEMKEVTSEAKKTIAKLNK